MAGHPKVTVHHLLAAILENAPAREAIERAGGSTDRLAASVSTALGQVPSPSFWERLASLAFRSRVVESFGFRRAVRTASRHMRRAVQAEFGVVDVLAALFQDPSAAADLRDSGLSRLALLLYHCHGLTLATHRVAEVPPGVQCDVLVFNDHYTRMETVVFILEAAFGLRPAEAYKTMMRIHQKGSVQLGPYQAEEAKRKLEFANQMAADAEAPLRLELQALPM